MPRNLLITGKPGIGKTTLVKRLVGILERPKCGFITEEIRKEGKRRGFCITTFSGKQGILACDDLESKFRVGKYGVDIGVLDQLGTSEIEKGLREEKMILLDEIGKMELCSEKFKQAVQRALDSKNGLVATITLSPLPFVNRIKVRDDIELFTLNRENQDEVLGILLDRLTD